MSSKEQIRRYIESELLDGQTIRDDENLLLSGLVDSLGIMRLVAHLEETASVSIPPEAVTIENFMSVDAIDSYMRGQTGSTTDSAT